MATTNQTKSIVISEEDVSVLECPVCFYIPAVNEQIYLCENGHHTCKNCYSKLANKQCPLCRMEMFQTRFPIFISNILPVLLIKSIYEAHLRTCITTEQIHEQWLVGVDQSMLFGFKNMVSTYSNLLQKSTKKIGEITFFTKQNLQFDETMHDALFASERLKSTFF